MQNFLKMIDYVAPMVNEIDIHVERRLMYELEDRKMKANRDFMKTFGQVLICRFSFLCIWKLIDIVW